jgi:hypothetical protein
LGTSSRTLLTQNFLPNFDPEFLPKSDPELERMFWFYPEWTIDPPKTPERIGMPNGEMLGLNEISRRLNDPKIPNREVYEWALEYYHRVREMDVDERYNRYDQSFRDGEDLKRCGEKYPATKSLQSST